MSIVPGLLERYEQRIQALNEGMRALERIGAKALEERRTKECSRCKDTKSLTDFSKHARYGLQSWCKPCNAEYGRDRRRKIKKRRHQEIFEKSRQVADQKLLDQMARHMVYAIAAAEQRQQNQTDPCFKERLDLLKERDETLLGNPSWKSQVDQGQQHDLALTKGKTLGVVLGLSVWLIIVLLIVAVIS